MNEMSRMGSYINGGIQDGEKVLHRRGTEPMAGSRHHQPLSRHAPCRLASGRTWQLLARRAHAEAGDFLHVALGRSKGLHGIEDGPVAGAATDVAVVRVLDLLLRGVGVLRKQTAKIREAI